MKGKRQQVKCHLFQLHKDLGRSSLDSPGLGQGEMDASLSGSPQPQMWPGLSVLRVLLNSMGSLCHSPWDLLRGGVSVLLC